MAIHARRSALSRHRSQRGAILVQVAVAMIVLIAFTAFVADYGLMWVARRQAQNAADAGAMAGAIALAFDDFDDRSATGPAKLTAQSFALANLVAGDNPDVNINTDVTFPACPDDGSNTCIRVDVYRNLLHSNALPIWFGQLVGLTDQGVQATAIAQATSGNASDCLKPFAIPDKWDDFYDQDAPIEVNEWTPEDHFERTTDDLGNGGGGGGPTPLVPPDVYVAPTETEVGTGFNLAEDLGRLLVLKAPGPQESLAPGFFFPIRLPLPGGEMSNGGDDYRENIAMCNGVPVKIGDTLENEPGNLVGPTAQGMQDLYDLDPDATYNESTMQIEGSCAQSESPCAPISPRLVAVPVFDTQVYYDGKLNGLVTLRIANILGFFINEIQGGEVSGYFMMMPGLTVGGGVNLGPGSSFLTSVVLVR